MEPSPSASYSVPHIVPERVPWCCVGCHKALGHVEKYNGLRRLHVYDGECRVVAVITAGIVFCPRCGSAREWFAATDGMERLVEKVMGSS